jgi:hypothetical protein
MLICRYMFGWQFFVRCHGQLLMDHVTAHMALSRNGVHAHMALLSERLMLMCQAWLLASGQWRRLVLCESAEPEHMSVACIQFLHAVADEVTQQHLALVTQLHTAGCWQILPNGEGDSTHAVHDVCACPALSIAAVSE